MLSDKMPAKFVTEDGNVNKDMVYCTTHSYVIEYVTKEFTDYIIKNSYYTSFSFMNKIPSKESADFGFFCVESKNNDTSTFELYECTNKQYGWILSDIRKRIKKVKQLVAFPMKRYPPKEVIVDRIRTKVDELKQKQFEKEKGEKE